MQSLPPYHHQNSTQPGQFQASPFNRPPPYSPSPQPTRGPKWWHWYRIRDQKTQVGMGRTFLFVSVIFCCCMTVAIESCSPTSPPGAPTAPTPSQSATTFSRSTSMTTVIVTPTSPVRSSPRPTSTPRVTTKTKSRPTPTPKATTKPKPRPLPTPRATAKPNPTPTPCSGVNCNPWGYNFSPGQFIYSPPSDFCAYFSCIDNFPNGHGYVIECHDGQYSKSGGRQGACSDHNGVWRPLYAH